MPESAVRPKPSDNEAMLSFLRLCAPKLKESGTLVLFFNAREEASWTYLDHFSSNAGRGRHALHRLLPTCVLCFLCGSGQQERRAEERLRSRIFALGLSRTLLAQHPGLDL